MPEPREVLGSAFDVAEPLPQRLDWRAALGAVLRKDCGRATIDAVFDHRRGVQVRVRFGAPVPADEVEAAVGVMQAKASELARRMRQHEEDAVLADFERAETEFREGVTLLQRATSLIAGAKSAAELTAAATTLAQAARSLAGALLPPHLAALLP